MKPFHTALSFLIFAATLGIQAQIVHGFQDSSDCCLSYTSRVHCSRYKNYFPTSGGCTKPAIIFVSKKGTLVCANPSDLRVQKCIKRLEQNSQPQIYKQ
ncbi:C-C motif chemokine 9 isoform X1 [Rattus norvegicus]|uniref:C-C motif chemokine 9 isoform X1 n=1 Tax=Rattus norvegicus TaxID=10116 RepID=UPI0004E48DE8|nr:C-C motif chemokine 9 isoform X1 [Rattus norvegicus]|eukprot:XP_008766290.1 PREDICTED: C-C motif chemokine 9 isoform X1 [Rattus norvegicus]